MDTGTIDRLFLELSQFTKAKTAREIDLEGQLARALAAIGRTDLKDVAKANLLKVLDDDWELLTDLEPRWRETVIDQIMAAFELPPA